MNRVRGRVSGELNARKNRVTETIDSVAGTIREVGEPLRKLPYPALGDYAEDAAARLERVAKDLRARNVEDLAQDLGELARRRPAVFVGAGLAAGLLAGRFLKSAPRTRRPHARVDRARIAERANRPADTAMDRIPRRRTPRGRARS